MNVGLGRGMCVALSIQFGRSLLRCTEQGALFCRIGGGREVLRRIVNMRKEGTMAVTELE